MASFLQPSNRQTFSFPLLKSEENLKCLKELGISVKQEELLQPEEYREACKRILELLAEITTGITSSEISQPAFAGLDVIAYPELHDDSIPQLNSFRACSQMMEMCEVLDFSIKDFISPTSKRLRRQLSGIINFAKFREERLMLLSELSAKREELLEKLNLKTSQNESLTMRLIQLREQTSEEGAIITTTEEDCKTIKEEIASLNQLQSRLREETSAFKSLNSQLKSDIAATTSELENSLDLKNKLQGQIVTSPEKFRKQVLDVAESLQLEQKDTKVAERKLRDLTLWLTNVEEAQYEVSAGLDSIQELRVEVERQKTVIVELDACKQEKGVKAMELAELDQDVQRLARTGNRSEEKLQLLRDKCKGRGLETQSFIENLHKQLIDAEHQRLQVFLSKYKSIWNNIRQKLL